MLDIMKEGELGQSESPLFYRAENLGHRRLVGAFNSTCSELNSDIIPRPKCSVLAAETKIRRLERHLHECVWNETMAHNL